ncbi:MAG: TetR/AcrR family transcriptional regulator [Paracoccaceae bacterium]
MKQIAPQSDGIRTAARGPQKRGLKRRRKLIETAVKIFETTPIEDVSYQDIAAAAEIPLPSCYHFYPGKVDLIRAIAEDQTVLFNEVCFAPFDMDGITTWEDIVHLWLDRALQFHRKSLARRQIFLGRHMPAEVRIDKQIREKNIAYRLRQMIYSVYAIPDAPEMDRVFFQAIEIATLMVSLDYMEKGQLDEDSNRFASLAMLSYLRNFIPPIVSKIG